MCAVQCGVKGEGRREGGEGRENGRKGQRGRLGKVRQVVN